MAGGKTDSSGVMFPPPLAHLAMLVAGLLLHFVFPSHLLPLGWIQFAIGLPLVGVAAALALSAVRAMRLAKTQMNAYKPSTAIVVRGPYGFSRNPMYLALTILYVGIAVSVNAIWPLPLLPVALAAISLGVVARDERYLERKFGDEYLNYKTRVRRWI